ncbi:MAG: ACP S-malonyltransferase [Actinobacteria bacterium]|nr:ACP S-malonyltransferase [Actinomycetota bacterium]MCA1721114.1 ACP S-malonyltransferase [Actinomycetota bacterium]
MPTALVFPGQGSQRPGMGAPWRDTPGWQLVREASELVGRDLERLLADADADELRATREAQVATFLTSMLALRALPDGLDVVAVAGHSLGELSALVAAGVLDELDGLRLVVERGEAMRAAADARPGTMAAVLGLEWEAAVEVLTDVVDAWPANDNAPSHVVVSGTAEGVAAAGAALKDAGARRVLPLPVGGAFHTPLMEPARERLETALGSASYRPARCPVIANTTALPYEEDVAGTLSQQLTAPVRWRGSLLTLPPVDRVVEVGAGGVLTGLVKRTLPGTPVMSFDAPEVEL